MSEAPFGERMLAEFHRLVPEVDVVVVPQEPPPSSFGVHAEQVEQQAAAARDEALESMGALWSVLTGGLPAPPAVTTSWRQESSYTSSVLAVVSARYDGAAPATAERVAAAERALAADGWATRRRDVPAPRSLRLVASRGRVQLEVSAWSRPAAYDVDVRCGPIPVGTFGTDLLAQPPGRPPFPGSGG